MYYYNYKDNKFGCLRFLVNLKMYYYDYKDNKFGCLRFVVNFAISVTKCTYITAHKKLIVRFLWVLC